MVHTFPLTLPNLADLLPLESAPWRLVKFEEISGYGSGEWQSAKLMPDLWEAECRTIQMYHADAAIVMGRLDVLGSMETAYLHNPAQPYPVADPDGSIFGSSTPVIAAANADRKRLSISGLPAAYTITDGDLFQIDYDSGERRALVRAVETITANGSGATNQFEVRPLLRPAIAADDPISFVKPAAKVKIVPNSVKTETSGPFTRITFTARQTLQAD